MRFAPHPKAKQHLSEKQYKKQLRLIRKIQGVVFSSLENSAEIPYVSPHPRLSVKYKYLRESRYLQ